ncbi:hypothetical protein ANCCAN_09876 [Ancylostoma caninum]|uniref:Thrombospondin type 1 domain protein n=1 Tax=Ancylostoma caninum TaxID=29170 RepID=A0A368GIB4_ANCCA|nr:hypothetical protein ANCCAN_09876 [Ancylostoma caninum]
MLSSQSTETKTFIRNRLCGPKSRVMCASGHLPRMVHVEYVTVETCAAASCPLWSDWGPWEGCSLTCGQGQERRSRKCQTM